MSLVKPPRMTPEKLAANQANARQSRGPTSREGVQRIREAQIIHGCYSKAPHEAMRALGENPQDFDRLLDSLFDVWEPQNEYEAELVRRLARVMWRLDRSDRIHEGMTVYQVELMDRHLERQSEEDAASHKKRLAALERLLEAASRIDFYTQDAEFNDLNQVYGENLAGRGERVCLRMLQLQRPEDVAPPAKRKIPAPPPLEGDEREPARADLRSLLRQEIEAENVAYRQRRDRRAREASDSYRDAYIAPSHPQAALILRVEDSAFHQLRHLHQMLTEIKARRPDNSEPSENSPDEGESHDIDENKGSDQNDS